jgi:hypothetical protein
MTVTTYTRFNRHESMNAETRMEIMEIIRELIDFDNTRRLENFMYGLFDGYLYSDIQIEALQLPTEIGSRIMRVFDICNRYPKSQTQNN